MFYCPCCGGELNFDSKVFLNGNRAVIGCEACADISVSDAEDVLDYVEEDDRVY